MGEAQSAEIRPGVAANGRDPGRRYLFRDCERELVSRDRARNRAIIRVRVRDARPIKGAVKSKRKSRRSRRRIDRN